MACGSAAVPHVAPSPPLPPGTSGYRQHLGEVGANSCPPLWDSRHFAPCKERWETWHQDLTSCTAPQPPPASCPLPDTCSLWPEPPCLTELSDPHSLPLHPFTPQHAASLDLGCGKQSGPAAGAPPTSPSVCLLWSANTGFALLSRGIPGCPQEQAPAAHQLLAWLKKSILK